MKLILLLAAVLVVGLLVTQQLNKGKEAHAEQAAEMGTGKPPKVPTNPGDVPKFEEDMKKFMEDEAAKQAEKVDQATQ
ncbi:MAG: hypothetical protein ACI92N_001775 [Pseudomonadales bacterium]|jgi:hypothetical protein|uniref:hypothetical protein n=1 Tax=Marinobacter maritimus TaxID=277961 RepID=UPI0011A4FC80|nr:hypothetical protein [Marinobacter maritimus]|tara:strand:+ start:1030 stop:1263 length:234 start_codon:yes stop_codon:yes gene_type:complete